MNFFINSKEKIFVGSQSAGEIIILKNIQQFRNAVFNSRKLLIKIITNHQ